MPDWHHVPPAAAKLTHLLLTGNCLGSLTHGGVCAAADAVPGPVVARSERCQQVWRRWIWSCAPGGSSTSFCAGHLILCWPLLQDLSGGNVMLTSSDTSLHGFCAKVADFGLARWVLCLSWAAAFPDIVQDALAVHGEVEPR